MSGAALVDGWMVEVVVHHVCDVMYVQSRRVGTAKVKVVVKLMSSVTVLDQTSRWKTPLPLTTH